MLTSSPHFRSSKHGPARRHGGFTLIELLVVVAIISVLGSVVFTMIVDSTAKARDAQRMKDIETIQGAVEQYYRDNGHYPITRCVGSTATYDIVGFDIGYSSAKTCATVGGVGGQTIAQTLSSYIGGIVHDPRYPETGCYVDGGYLYSSTDGANYLLRAYKTPENLNNFPKAVAYCPAGLTNGQCNTLSGCGAIPLNEIRVTN